MKIIKNWPLHEFLYSNHITPIVWWMRTRQDLDDIMAAEDGLLLHTRPSPADLDFQVFHRGNPVSILEKTKKKVRFGWIMGSAGQTIDHPHKPFTAEKYTFPILYVCFFTELIVFNKYLNLLYVGIITLTRAISMYLYIYISIYLYPYIYNNYSC